MKGHWPEVLILFFSLQMLSDLLNISSIFISKVNFIDTKVLLDIRRSWKLYNAYKALFLLFLQLHLYPQNKQFGCTGQHIYLFLLGYKSQLKCRQRSGSTFFDAHASRNLAEECSYNMTILPEARHSSIHPHHPLMDFIHLFTVSQ